MLDFPAKTPSKERHSRSKRSHASSLQSALLPLAARWLVTERTNGYYWSSTKDTAFAIFGLIDYVKVSRELTPSYDVEVYLNGETVIAEHIERPDAATTFMVNRKGAAVGETNQIRVVKRGQGTLYLHDVARVLHRRRERQPRSGSSELNVTREYLPASRRTRWLQPEVVHVAVDWGDSIGRPDRREVASDEANRRGI